MAAHAISDKDMEDFFASNVMAGAGRPDPLLESSFFDNSTYGFDWSSPFVPAPTTSSGAAIDTDDTALFDAYGQPSQLALDLSPSSAFDLVLRPAPFPYPSASARSDAPRSRKLVHQLRPDGQGISSTELLSLEGPRTLSFSLPLDYPHTHTTSNNGYTDTTALGCNNSNMLPSSPPITPNLGFLQSQTPTSPIRKHRPAPILPIAASNSSCPPVAKRSKSHSMLKTKTVHGERRLPKHHHSHHQLGMLQTSSSTVPDLPLSPPISSRFPAEPQPPSARPSDSGLRDFMQHNATAHGSNHYAINDFSSSSPSLWDEHAMNFQTALGGDWNVDGNTVFDTPQIHHNQNITLADPLSAASGSSLDSHPSYGTWDTDLAHAGLMMTNEGFPWKVEPSSGSTTTPSISPEVVPSFSSTSKHERHASSYAPPLPPSTSCDARTVIKRQSFPRSRRSVPDIKGEREPHSSSTASTSVSHTSSGTTPKVRSKKSYGSLKGVTSPRKARSTTAMHTAANMAAHSASKSTSALEVGFVNFTPSDSRKILTGVAPSGSSKTKARREREAIERRRRLSEAATRAVRDAGGNLEELKRQGVLEELMR